MLHEEGGEGFGPFGRRIVGEIFLDVLEHPESCGALIAGFVLIDFGGPLDIREGFGDEFLVGGGVLARFAAFRAILFLCFAVSFVVFVLGFLNGAASPEIDKDAFLDHAFRPCGAESGEAIDAAERGEDDIVVDGFELGGGHGPGLHFQAFDFVGLAEDGAGDILKEGTTEWSEVLGLGYDGIKYASRIFGEFFTIGIIGGGLEGEDEPSKLLAEGGLEVFVGDLVIVFLFPLAEFGGGFLFFFEINEFLALQVKLVGGVFRGHGGGEGGESGAEALIDSGIGGVADGFELLEEGFLVRLG